MDSAELRRHLRFGFGRVVLFLREVDAVPYRAVILDACVHNDVYDPQINHNRPHYLWDVIEATRDASFYRDHLLAALPTSDQIDDGDMIPALVARFAAAGDEEAMEALRAAASREPFGYPGEALIDAAGVDGFLFIANVIGDAEPDEDDDWIDWLILRTSAVERLGEEVVDTVHDSTSAQKPRVAQFLANLNRARAWEARPRATRPDPSKATYDQVKQWIENGNAPSKVNSLPMRWGRVAGDEDIRRAAEDFLLIPDDDLHRLHLYLQMFQFRPFPLPPTRLITLTSNDDERIAKKALRALEHISHPDVRQLAMTVRTSEEWWRRHRSIGLLTNNYAAGDHAMIEQLIVVEEDEDVIHAYGIDVRDIYDVTQDRAFSTALLLLYERNPCPMCRHSLVKYLHDMDALPKGIVEEAQYDAELDLRQLATDIKERRRTDE